MIGAWMEKGESLLEAIYEDESFEDAEDVEMQDVEEGEFVESKPHSGIGHSDDGGDNIDKDEKSGRQKNKKKKKKNKKRKRSSGPGQNFTDINRFVLDACRRLKERKSYMVYTAVGCLGVSALSDLLKEVDVIQSCGGQMTVDGRRFRNGGGILWNTIKAREPMAYKEIMRKTKEFEKQFKQKNTVQAPEANKKKSSQQTTCGITDGSSGSVPDCSDFVTRTQQEQSPADGKHKSVHDRLRIPVSYEDLVVCDPKDDKV
ncbi:hypothetical protein K2173_002401 [Erythroxylum novogranatense]|uniref:Phosphorylated adapter RNA export protein n=1 Tax=Erythroxylum novogranatense TaxID=1862640 RepID=A0AAV8TBL9_9ROSI|nr:hypothetical protein K2173_002401 [Erythroxylum novogranatense]